MAYKFRVILDVEEDVFRDIIVASNIHLEELHFTIAKSFGFKGQEMASFYTTDVNWEQGEEIPLFDMSEDGMAITMEKCLVAETFKRKGDKLIYVYDFMSMWSFFVEVTDIADATEENLPIIALSFGDVPDEAPEKEFTAEISLDDEDEIDIFNDENNFDSIDDLDLDNY
ncbi:pRiA4b ORF-3-like protein [Lutibacter agarilyticus]|uniref:PRiA4b ORF-3-like protein n=1 Tax=Lutibacter agarilyticus TaxID=1109740 RepID=A0A238XHX9_9FLAO|nr:hypothetical protein [Lutibacter agarilyticus]SNR58615.1 pRiA4b ORF-3-like protein [Lutibacter agarilyticus]